FVRDPGTDRTSRVLLGYESGGEAVWVVADPRRGTAAADDGAAAGLLLEVLGQPGARAQPPWRRRPATRTPRRPRMRTPVRWPPRGPCSRRGGLRRWAARARGRGPSPRGPPRPESAPPGARPKPGKAETRRRRTRAGTLSASPVLIGIIEFVGGAE